MSITNLIKQINDKLLDIKDNLGVDEDTSLDDVNAAIDELKSAATSEKQQIVILYTYAKDDGEADKKEKPKFEWEANNTAKITEEGDWTPIKPIRKSNDEVLYVMFVSVSENSEPDYGVPIRLTGEKGDKGDKGSDGLNAVALGSSVIIKLYTKNEPKETPTITFDTDSYRTNGEIVENIKVLNSSDWTSTLGSNESGYEITIKVTVDKPDVEILAGPTATIPAIKSVTNQYMLSDNKDGCDETEGEWSDEYLNVSDEAPYLWSRTCTTYATGQEFFSKPFLITQLATYIKSIEVTYGASDSVSKQPDTWTQDVPKGTVIWKREITTFNDNTLKEVICPMSIQGEPGIKYVGSYNSEDELADINLDYDNEFIGRIGVIVAGNTYVWYGADDPNLGENCVRINNNYWWLKLGNLTPSMIEILYEDLVKLRNEGKLIPGMQYKIVDYVGVISDFGNDDIQGVQMPIIVTAVTIDRLSELASVDYNGDSWKIWYCLDNDSNRFAWARSDSKGVIYRMIDSNFNDFPGDPTFYFNVNINKNVKVNPWYQEKIQYFPIVGGIPINNVVIDGNVIMPGELPEGITKIMAPDSSKSYNISECISEWNIPSSVYVRSTDTQFINSDAVSTIIIGSSGSSDDPSVIIDKPQFKPHVINIIVISDGTSILTHLENDGTEKHELSTGEYWLVWDDRPSIGKGWMVYNKNTQLS